MRTTVGTTLTAMTDLKVRSAMIAGMSVTGSETTHQIEEEERRRGQNVIVGGVM